MAVVTMTRETVLKWNAKDFASYYMEKVRQLTGVHKMYAVSVWAIYTNHIKRFMKRHNLSNLEYKAFVDWVFSPDFLCGRTTVNFLCVVDTDVHKLYVRLTKRDSPHVVQAITVGEEQALRGKIESSTTLFSEDA